MTGSLARDSRRTSLSGSAFVRLLASLVDPPAPASNDAFAQSLSRWFDWTDAIPLSEALNAPQARSHDAAPGVGRAAIADAREAGRVRAGLEKAIADALATDADRPRRAVGNGGRMPAPATPATAPATDTPGDFSPHRQRYVACQQAMEARIAPLRRRVRATLAGASPAMAKLAALDAVMEQVVGAQERALLSTAPRWLERHFERLAGARTETPADAAAPEGPPSRSPAGEVAGAFRRTMQDVLLAELDLRLQPVEGLLEALRMSSPDSHE